MAQVKAMTGLRFGRLIVTARSGYAGRHVTWACQCECGQKVIVNGAKLRNGHTLSCGCYQKFKASRAKAKHDMHDVPEYIVWKGMWQRCTNPNGEGWENYGGRGITVCDRWKDFVLFVLDMGQRPSPKHSIERLDNDKGYSPENCVWATRAQQNANKRQRKDSVIHRSKS